MAASNAQAQNKKIKPINHPNLVLKTPIAYHGGSDLSVLPIDKDGIGEYTTSSLSMIPAYCCFIIISYSYQ